MATENVSRDELPGIFDNLTLIVFNYDRCIEAYFPRALEAYYGISRAEANEVFSRLEIIHPYGLTGGLSPSGELSAEFGSTDVNLLEVAQSIKTFSEGLADPKQA